MVGDRLSPYPAAGKVAVGENQLQPQKLLKLKRKMPKGCSCSSVETHVNTVSLWWCPHAGTRGCGVRAANRNQLQLQPKHRNPLRHKGFCGLQLIFTNCNLSRFDWRTVRDTTVTVRTQRTTWRDDQ
jgi:hypothetical protein